jgi:hypothetical protein
MITGCDKIDLERMFGVEDCKPWIICSELG